MLAPTPTELWRKIILKIMARITSPLNASNPRTADIRRNRRVRVPRGESDNQEGEGNGYPHVMLRHELTALVIDGDNSCRMLHEGLLRAFGVRTESVDSGRAAIELVTYGARFDLIVLDKILPVVDGPETTRLMRAMGVQSKMLGVTACDGERDREEFLAAGIDEFIEKPLSAARLAPILLEIDRQII